MRINKTWYEAAHGKEPRGFGNWAFEVHTFEHGSRITTINKAHGTYAEALGSVKRRLLGRGTRDNIEIVVLP